MELLPYIETARAQVRAGNTAAALSDLLAAMPKAARYTAVTRTLRVMEADLERTRQQETKGILSFAEAQRVYNQVNDRFLAVLDDLALGKTSAAAPKANLRWGIIGLLALLLAGALGFWLRQQGSDASASACPHWQQPEHFKVLLLPFRSIGERSKRPEIPLQLRIEALTSKVGLPVEIGFRQDALVNTAQEADEANRRCGSDMAVWGEYDVLPNDSLRINVRYQFAHAPAGQSTGFQGVPNVTALADGSAGLRTFDDALFSMCAMLAMRGSRPEVTQRWLEKIQERTATEQQMLEWLQKQPKSTQ